MEQLKEIKQPLGLYDVFGYILPGFLLFSLIIIDNDVNPIIQRIFENDENLLIMNDLFSVKLYNYFFQNDGFGSGLIPLILLLIFSYVLGHMISAFSSFMSKQFLIRYLKQPSDNLLHHLSILSSDKGFFYRNFKRIYYCVLDIRLFGKIIKMNYKKPLPDEIQYLIKNKIDTIYNKKISHTSYYWLIYSYLSVNYSHITRRLQHFVNLSGYSRNTAGTFFLFVIFKLIYIFFLSQKKFSLSDLIVLVYLSCALIMTWSYLRLQKRQAYDMFYIFLSVDINKKLESNSNNSEKQED
jgi:hypothetical protein